MPYFGRLWKRWKGEVSPKCCGGRRTALTVPLFLSSFAGQRGVGGETAQSGGESVLILEEVLDKLLVT